MAEKPITRQAGNTARALQYSLRSSFFYRHRNQFKAWLRQLKAASKRRCDWSDLNNLGISETAWHRAETSALNPMHIFCHPEVVRRTPTLVGYYRSIAALSQKGAPLFVSGAGRLEEGKTKVLSGERALALARLFNSYMSAIIESDHDISVLGPAGTLEAAIEVKAGKDPAGALERYGAAKKPFDRALRLNKSAITVYLADCLTRAVKKAIEADRLVTRDFDLTQVLLIKEQRDNFLGYVKWLLRL